MRAALPTASPACVGLRRRASRAGSLRVFAAAPAAETPKGLMSQTDSWRLLRAHADEPGEIPHLRELLSDNTRCEKLFAEYDGIVMDYTRQVGKRGAAGTRACALTRNVPRSASPLAP